MDIGSISPRMYSLCAAYATSESLGTQNRRTLDSCSRSLQRLGFPNSSNFLHRGGDDRNLQSWSARAQVLVVCLTPHFLRKRRTSSDTNPTFWTQRLFHDLVVATSMRSREEQHRWHNHSRQSGHAVADLPLGRPAVPMARAVAQDRQFLALCRTVNVDCSLPPVTSFRVQGYDKKSEEELMYGTSFLKVAQARQCALRNCIRFWLTWRKGRCALMWSRWSRSQTGS